MFHHHFVNGKRAIAYLADKVDKLRAAGLSSPGASLSSSLESDSSTRDTGLAASASACAAWRRCLVECITPHTALADLLPLRGPAEGVSTLTMPGLYLGVLRIDDYTAKGNDWQ